MTYLRKVIFHFVADGSSSLYHHQYRNGMSSLDGYMSDGEALHNHNYYQHHGAGQGSPFLGNSPFRKHSEATSCASDRNSGNISEDGYLSEGGASFYARKIQNRIAIEKQKAAEEQRKKWLPALASGEKIGCFGLTEPNHGSNPSGMLTNAKKVDGGYILNGTKMWITNGSVSDVAVVWAKDEDGVIKGFLVEKDFEGFSAPLMKRKWSLRASITSELVLKDVFVPDENLLPNIEGLKGPLGCLTQARYGIGWGTIGAAMAVYEASVNYSKERIQFDKPIGGYQMTQEKLAWMLTEITKGQLLALHIGKNKDDKTMRFQEISMLKRNNTWVARECAKLAREIHGANGISGEYPIMRHLMNIESVYTYEGTHEMHTLVLGHDITGIDAYR